MSELATEQARAAWSVAQGLSGPADETLAQTLERTGWGRTLGGVAGYLALSARNVNATVQAVTQAVAAGDIGVSPAIRGCIYLVPRAHEALALRIAHRLSARRMAKEREKLGMTDAELDAVGEAVLGIVQTAPHSTAQLRKALPDGAVRSLGDAGKKMGVTSTLPPALRRLEFAGRLRRIPIDARLDHERYAWSPHALDVGMAGDEDVVEMTRLYLRWAGPSTRKELAAWTGLNQTQAKRGIAACGAIAASHRGEEVYVLDAAPAPTTGRVALLPAMDNLFAMRGSAHGLVDPAYHDVQVAHFGPGRRSTLANMKQPIERTMVRDGQLVGLWAIDPTTHEVVTNTTPQAGPLPLDAEVQRVSSVIADVGTCKVFSIDTDKRLTDRAQRLRDLEWP